MKSYIALLIEDNTTIAEQVVEFFGAHDWTVDYARNGQQGMTLAKQNIYDAVILDLNLPDIDGLQVCESIKQDAKAELPIIMLTARDSLDNKIEGLATGADDYLTKPFNLRELMMRCKALARRHTLHQQKVLCLAGLKINLHKHQYTWLGKTLVLTPIGGKILSALAIDHPHPVSRADLMHKIWGDSPPNSDALKAHVYSLRRTLEAETNAIRLVTVPNLGYQLEVKEPNKKKADSIEN